MESRNDGAMMRKPDFSPVRAADILTTVVTPVADIYETADAFVVKLDMPGSSKELIELTIDADRLTVQGSIQHLHGEPETMIHNEIGMKKYSRLFNLGDGIVRDRIVAEFEDGVLTVTLPKTEAMKSRRIDIR